METNIHTGWKVCADMMSEAHIMIGGTTGAGKSTFLHSVMWTWLTQSPANIGFILVDCKGGVELGRYKYLPHTLAYCTNIADTRKALDCTINVMRKRYETMTAQGISTYKGQQVWIVIDEMAALTQQDPRGITDRLGEIGRLGRAAGIHWLCATQAPDRKTFPAVIAQNATCAFALRCRSAIESRQCVGVGGAEKLPLHGAAIRWSGTGVERVSIPMTPIEDQNARIQYWVNQRSKWQAYMPRKAIGIG